MTIDLSRIGDRTTKRSVAAHSGFITFEDFTKTEEYTITKLPDGIFIASATAVVVNPFNNTSATISIGDSADSGINNFISSFNCKNVASTTSTTNISAWYPTGSILTIKTTFTGVPTVGKVFYVIEYIEANKSTSLELTDVVGTAS